MITPVKYGHTWHAKSIVPLIVHVTDIKKKSLRDIKTFTLRENTITNDCFLSFERFESFEYPMKL